MTTNRGKEFMKIVTVNIPEPYIRAIDKLTGYDGLYPSRSELIRVAVRAFLIKELKNAEELSEYNQKMDEKKFDPENYVRVPESDSIEPYNPYRTSCKTFRIVKK